MHKRIQELTEQCQIETYGINGELLAFGFDSEKFAELVVEECARRAEAYAYMSQNFNVLADELRTMIGVQE